jgi:hypothetical protein
MACLNASTRLLEKCYQVAFREDIYHALDELQADLDTWLKQCDESRAHSCEYCSGKTQMQTLLDNLPVPRRKMLNQTVQTVAPTAQRSDQILATIYDSYTA